MRGVIIRITPNELISTTGSTGQEVIFWPTNVLELFCDLAKVFGTKGHQKTHVEDLLPVGRRLFLVATSGHTVEQKNILSQNAAEENQGGRTFSHPIIDRLNIRLPTVDANKRQMTLVTHTCNHVGEPHDTPTPTGKAVVKISNRRTGNLNDTPCNVDDCQPPTVSGTGVSSRNGREVGRHVFPTFSTIPPSYFLHRQRSTIRLR